MSLCPSFKISNNIKGFQAYNNSANFLFLKFNSLTILQIKNRHPKLNIIAKILKSVIPKKILCPAIFAKGKDSDIQSGPYIDGTDKANGEIYCDNASFGKFIGGIKNGF